MNFHANQFSDGVLLRQFQRIEGRLSQKSVELNLNQDNRDWHLSFGTFVEFGSLLDKGRDKGCDKGIEKVLLG